MKKIYSVFYILILLLIFSSCNNSNNRNSTNSNDNNSTYPIKWVNSNNDIFEIINDTIAKFHREIEFEEQSFHEYFEGKYHLVGKNLFFSGVSNNSSSTEFFFSLTNDNKSLIYSDNDIYKLSEENYNNDIKLKEYQFDKSKMINNLKQDNLKGDVKSVFFKCSDYIIDRGNGKGVLIKRLDNDVSIENEKKEYSKDGFITKLTDYRESVKYNFDEFGKVNNNSFEYDYKGLVIFQGTAFGKVSYTYANSGRLMNKMLTNGNKKINDIYYYNDKGDIEKINRQIILENASSFFLYREYKYLEYDNKGNWIKRQATKYVSDIFDEFIIKENDEYEYMIEERKIEYWNSNSDTNNQNKTSISLNDFKGGTFKNNTNIYVIFKPRNNKGGKANMIDGQRIERYVYDIKDNEIYLHEGTVSNYRTGEPQAVDSKTFYVEDNYIYYMSGGRKYKYYPSTDKLRDYFYY